MRRTAALALAPDDRPSAPTAASDQARGDEPAAGDQVDRLRSAMRNHPCHDCPDRDEHVRWAERAWQTEREQRRLAAGLSKRQTSIATAFDQVCAVLEVLGYLQGDQVTADGQRLRGLFSELDLLAAECLRQGIWDGLHPADLAACVSLLSYQTRGSEPAVSTHVPVGRARRALEQMESVWSDLHELESQHGLSYLREPDSGFARTVHRWAAGHPLAAVLADSDLTPGDLVRAMRQVLDSLDQVAETAPRPVADVARSAWSAVSRGVVAYEMPG
jgi:ATP-dependent RNA helicase HelY